MLMRITLAVLSAFLAACGRPEFTDAGDKGSLRELVARADLIVAGRVEAIKEIGRSSADGCSKLTLARIVADTIVKGEADEGPLEYYYFSPPCGSSRHVSESPRANAWRIVFLRREGGYWRAVADHWRDGIPLGSGGHSGRLARKLPPERAIAELLLTAGEVRSEDEFANSILFARQAALDLIGERRTGELLEALIANGPPPVRAVACLAQRAEEAIEKCAGRVLKTYGDRFERADFSGLSLGLVLRLDALSSYAEPEVASRAESWLPQARVAVGLPPSQRPVLASE